MTDIDSYGKLALEYGNQMLALQVLKSASGFYIGTSSDGLPVSRESKEYFRKISDAETALTTGSWTQRLTP